MTRWLAASRGAVPPVLTSADKTDKTDRTQPPIGKPPSEGNPAPVPSVLSVLSERRGGVESSPRAAIIHVLQSGLKTPGSIATATKLGATMTYQQLDRMTQEGLVTMQCNGALGLNASALNEGPLP